MESSEPCSARIRPFRPINDTEIICDIDIGIPHDEHAGDLLDYAYPGSVTRVTWWGGDRRCFAGDWPGGCATPSCSLPVGHRGSCV